MLTLLVERTLDRGTGELSLGLACGVESGLRRVEQDWVGKLFCHLPRPIAGGQSNLISCFVVFFELTACTYMIVHVLVGGTFGLCFLSHPQRHSGNNQLGKNGFQWTRAKSVEGDVFAAIAHGMY